MILETEVKANDLPAFIAEANWIAKIHQCGQHLRPKSIHSHPEKVGGSDRFKSRCQQPHRGDPFNQGRNLAWCWRKVSLRTNLMVRITALVRVARHICTQIRSRLDYIIGKFAAIASKGEKELITRLHFTLSVLMFANAVKLKESSGATHQIPSNLFTKQSLEALRISNVCRLVTTGTSLLIAAPMLASFGANCSTILQRQGSQRPGDRTSGNTETGQGT